MSDLVYRVDPTNTCIVTDAGNEIIKNGIHMRCPHCGTDFIHNRRTVPICNVGAVGKWECCKCRKQYNTITLPVPLDTTPEEFYENIRIALFAEEG